MDYSTLLFETVFRAPSGIAAAVLLLFGAGCATNPAGTDVQPEAPTFDYPDPKRFESDIEAFEAKDAQGMPPEDAILFVGSSSITRWNARLPADMAPLEVIGRGFGGSTMNDLIHYADRVVFPYQPKAIVVYEGDNDIESGASAEGVAESVEVFVDLVKERLPDAEIYFLSIKPTLARWSLWPEMRRANTMIRDYTRGRDDLHYIDIATPMLGGDGQPRVELLSEDHLHMTSAGYAIWTDIIKAKLLKDFGE